MKLKLTRPLIFFDLETTGLDVSKDHILELSYIKVCPDGHEEKDTLRFKPVDMLGNVIPIPEKTTAVHGISDADVADCPSFMECAESLYEGVFKDCDLAGFNSNRFDIPLLVEEFLRAGVSVDMSGIRTIDVQNIYHKLEKRNLAAALKFYCGKELLDAHHASADTEATYEVLQAQLDHYPAELQNDVDFLAEFSTMVKTLDFAGRVALDEEGKEIFTFGKHRNKRVEDVARRDPNFFNWIRQGDFPLNTKQVVEALWLKYK